MKVIIRAARISDAPVIEIYNRELARETEGRILDPELVRGGVAAVLKDRSKGIYYVAEREGAIAGQLMLTYEWSDWRNGMFWWVQSVFVAPEFRGQGVFRALIGHVFHLAKADAECRGLRLYAHHENHGALATYKKLGFERQEYEVYEWSSREALA